MKLTSIVLLTGILAAIPVVHAGAGTPTTSIISNLPDTTTGVMSEATTWIAMSFTVPPDGDGADKYGIAAIEVSLQRTGTPSSTEYQYRLYSNVSSATVSSAPGKELGSFAFPSFKHPVQQAVGAQFSSLFTLPIARSINLTPGTVYWIVLTSTSTSTTNLIQWNQTTNAAAGFAGASYGPVMTSADKGKTYQAFVGDIPTLQIDVTAR
jgi:hypothetical protein